MKKVLAVEDKPYYHDRWRHALAGKVELLSALSIEEAEAQFSAHPDIDAIAMDACVPGDEPNMAPLVRKFRRTFDGPMIAISGEAPFQEILVRAGCDHRCSKDFLPIILLKVLDL